MAYFPSLSQKFYKSNHNSLPNIPANPKESEFSNLWKEKTNVHLSEKQINPPSHNFSPSLSVSLWVSSRDIPEPHKYLWQSECCLILIENINAILFKLKSSNSAVNGFILYNKVYSK